MDIAPPRAWAVPQRDGDGVVGFFVVGFGVRLGESSEQATQPQDRHSHSSTHSSPRARHSGQPVACGLTGWARATWRHGRGSPESAEGQPGPGIAASRLAPSGKRGVTRQAIPPGTVGKQAIRSRLIG